MSSNTEGNKQAVVKIVVNSPTAAPVAEGNVAKAKEYMEQAQAVLGQVQAIQQQTQEIADDAAESANSAAESAGSAFAAAAPPRYAPRGITQSIFGFPPPRPIRR